MNKRQPRVPKIVQGPLSQRRGQHPVLFQTEHLERRIDMFEMNVE